MEEEDIMLKRITRNEELTTNELKWNNQAADENAITKLGSDKRMIRATIEMWEALRDEYDCGFEMETMNLATQTYLKYLATQIDEQIKMSGCLNCETTKAADNLTLTFHVVDADIIFNELTAVFKCGEANAMNYDNSEAPQKYGDYINIE
jgi:hypothetical protein